VIVGFVRNVLKAPMHSFIVGHHRLFGSKYLSLLQELSSLKRNLSVPNYQLTQCKLPRTAEKSATPLRKPEMSQGSTKFRGFVEASKS
jgi:hypothetical protein